MLFPSKRIGKFFLRLLIAYGLLIGSWPVLRGTYLASFRATGNMVFQPLGAQAKVTFLPLTQSDEKMDTKVHLENRRTGFMWMFPMNARLMGYLCCLSRNWTFPDPGLVCPGKGNDHDERA